MRGKTVATGAARLGDQCTGHGKFKPRINIQGSPNVFINGRQAHRQLDMWMIHSSGDSKHPSILARGSSSIFANGLPVGRIFDPVMCGGTVKTGSEDVFKG